MRRMVEPTLFSTLVTLLLHTFRPIESVILLAETILVVSKHVSLITQIRAANPLIPDYWSQE